MKFLKLSAITVLFCITSLVQAGAYYNVYAKININEDERQQKDGVNKYATILLGYRTVDIVSDAGNEIGMNVDIFTTGGGVSYSAGSSYKTGNNRYGLGIIKPLQDEGSEGIYLEFTRGLFTMRYIAYTTTESERVTTTEVVGAVTTEKNFTLYRDTKRGQLWVGLAHDF